MSALKLQQKLARREKQIQQAAANFDRVNKINKREEVLEDSPKALKLMRGVERRLDADFGLEALGKEPPLSVLAEADAIRFDFGVLDFGIKLSLPNSPGDPEEADIQCVADVSSSLNNKYFIWNSPAQEYYFWFNVDGAGADPMLPNMLGVEVAISENDIADDVAAALQAAMDAQSDISATVLLDTVSAANDDAGDVPDVTEGMAPTGFLFSVTQQGTDDDIILFSELGIQPGDKILFLEGALKGKYLEVVSIESASVARLEDVASFTSATDLSFRADLSAEKKSYF